MAFCFHRLFLCLSAQIVSEKCPKWQAKSFRQVRVTYEKYWQRVRESNPCTSLERAVS